MSRPELVSSSTHSRGSSIAICRISLRFFSPPEKPTLTPRRSISWSMCSFLATSRTRFMNSGVVSSASPRALRWALSAVRRNVMVATPGISIGYWKARNRPLAARSSGSISSTFSPSSSDFAFGHLVLLAAGEHVGERRLARSVRAHDGVDLALVDDEVEAVEDLLALDLDVQVLRLPTSASACFPSNSHYFPSASARRRRFSTN